MTVTVRFFASFAESLGVPSMVMRLDDGSTVRDVIDTVASMPGAAKLPPSPLVAVNSSYASQTRVLSEGDEVAFIPPVAGG